MFEHHPSTTAPPVDRVNTANPLFSKALGRPCRRYRSRRPGKTVGWKEKGIFRSHKYPIITFIRLINCWIRVYKRDFLWLVDFLVAFFLAGLWKGLTFTTKNHLVGRIKTSSQLKGALQQWPYPYLPHLKTSPKKQRGTPSTTHWCIFTIPWNVWKKSQTSWRFTGSNGSNVPQIHQGS